MYLVEAQNGSVKSQILYLGMRKFYEEGFKGVNMNQLAIELQMSKKTLYKYFTSKEELLLECLKTRNELFEKGLRERIEMPEISFERKIQNLVEFISAELDSTSVKFYAEIKSLFPDVYDSYAKRSKESGFNFLMTLLKEGQENGWIRSDINITFFSVIYSCALNQFLDPEFRKALPPSILEEIPEEPLTIYNMVNDLLFGGALRKESLINA